MANIDEIFKDAAFEKQERAPYYGGLTNFFWKVEIRYTNKEKLSDERINAQAK